jgi:hypothetical protein
MGEQCPIPREFLEPCGAMLERAERKTLANGIANPEKRRTR